MKSGVFIGCPTHDGRIDQGCALRLFGEASRERVTFVAVSQGLAVAPASNVLWADALNSRDAVEGVDCPGVGWFAMLHSDINPGAFWVDRLIALAEEYRADVMSAVVPIKNEHGLTSTAMSHPTDPLKNWCRLTLRQVNHRRFPKAFDSQMAREALASLPGDLAVDCPDDSVLLVNTGCMVVRLDRPWGGDVWFEQVDRVAKIDGKWQTVACPEDWAFSRKVSDAGGKVMATTDLRMIHRGPIDFPSDSAGRGWPRDVEGLGGRRVAEPVGGPTP